MMSQLFKELYDATIQQIEAVERLSKHYGLLNSQDYLEFQDNLNRLSLDNY